MARIVCVHGVGKQQAGEQTLLGQWVPALRDGLTRAGGRARVADTEVAMAFYGDLFLPPGQRLDGDEPHLGWWDVSPGWETELLMQWWSHAAAAEPQIVAPDAQNLLSGTSRTVQAALLALSQSRFFAGLAEKALISDLKQTHRYLTDLELRTRARDRVRALIGPDTSVVVAHSLGSVVAYEALCAQAGHSVRSFVTLGSPLGIRNLIFDRMDPVPVSGIGAWPGPFSTTWTNVADARDVVALVKDLRPCFGPRIVCHLVANGSQAHDATHYLTKEVTGAALAIGLG
ncbi:MULTISPECIES: hypothetical protein [Streptomyces]|uniref:Alpha/beta hydrolase n=1 Tax=Streptomyces koelreuteriae TaxID=2838015 RepID=A0ABX8FXJ8_9ACTN|nr:MULTISPECIES: hypothetical protein [Streptomyces]QWB25722.1 hypothetical protein KJK29_25910 [Streptomyces koelreuteriae]UUA08779.1 hypothetical protein NNW98_26065 [Streptomyces koelreuteriae]UUA16384.1 hypothetical protein NNW99_25950 [Streptomyces sp. CRCS-T-1]